MAVDIGPKIGIDGEAQFRKQIQDVNQSLKTLQSEMKLVTTEFDRSAESEEAYSQKNDILKESVSKLGDKLKLQEEALQKCTEKYGEADSRTQKWQQAVNETKTALADAENKIKDNEEAMENLGDESEETGKELKKAGDEGKSFGDKLSSACAVAVAAIGAASAAAGALAKEVIGSFGELEQNLGGSEAVFGEYASTIQKEGEQAYKNLGVSQSEYLATANKIGALFQGTGVEQQRSLELTTQAMQRAADMASVMGIDTSAALDAITGAAKGNYTMMDNLGVAMNNTALAAYAEQKGFDKLFSEMDNAEKAEVAMQYFFENTAQYAGNFAHEAAETVSGSIGLFTAAKDSLIAGLGNADADVAQLARNLVNAGVAVFQNVAPILQNVTSALPQVITMLLAAIQSMLPQLLSAGVQLIQAVMNGITQALPTLITIAGTIIVKLTEGLISSLPDLMEGAVSIVETLCNQLITLLPELVPVAIDVILKIVDTLISNVDMLVDSSIAIIFALADGLIAALPTLLEQAPVIIQKLVDALVRNAPLLLESALQLIVQLVNGLIDNLPLIGEATMDIIETILKGLADSFVSFVEMGGRLVQGLIEGFNDWFDWAWGKIKEWFNNVIDRVKGWLGIHSPSRVFANIGEMMAAGVGEGWENEFASVSKDINDSFGTLLPDATANIGVVSSMRPATNAGLADSVNALGSLLGGGSTGGDLNLVFNVNGREFYRATLADFRLIQAQNPIILNDF